MTSRFRGLWRHRESALYAIEKGLGPALRGLAWTAIRGRPQFIFIGHNTRFIMARNLQFGDGVSIGANSYIEADADLPCIIGNNVTIREGAWVQCRCGDLYWSIFCDWCWWIYRDWRRLPDRGNDEFIRRGTCVRTGRLHHGTRIP